MKPEENISITAQEGMLRSILMTSARNMSRCASATARHYMGGGGYHCGLPVLPPSAMFKEYADTPIVITLNPVANKYEAQAYLTDELGIPAERIVNHEAYKEALSCWYLENWLQLFEDKVLFCCPIEGANPAPTVYFDKNDTPRQKVAKLVDFRNSVKKALENGEPCVCSGCGKLKKIWSRTAWLLEFVEPAFKNYCNLHCVYCNQVKRIKSWGEYDADNITSTIGAMKEEGIIHSGTSINFAMGEITVHPRREEILSTFEGMRTHLVSNCVVYDEILARYLKRANSTINCSVDAGTRETYKKIKGADCFDRVCDNLKRYSRLARIELKYIFLERENDNYNDEDVNGFIRLASDIRPVVVILSRDNRNLSPLSDFVLTQMAHISKELTRLDIKNYPSIEYFTKEDEERFRFLVDHCKTETNEMDGVVC